MENYNVLAVLETKYFYLKDEKKHYEPVDGGCCFILFLLFILPGILYLIIKSKQEERIEKYNYEIQQKMY